MSALLDRAKQAARYYGMPVGVWQESLGLRNSHFYNLQTLSRKLAAKIEERYPEINTEWLATGRGEMLVSQNNASRMEGFSVPLVPMGASCTDSTIESQIQDNDCEKIISPVKNIAFAITVNGDSMSPEFPNGSKVFAQKVNADAFIEWGNAYVLDTINGVVVKNVFQSKDDSEQIVCRSVNQNYSDFAINKSDIRAWYKVRLCMILK
jgi:SOS-response transcriptional repressor LexA